MHAHHLSQKETIHVFVRRNTKKKRRENMKRNVKDLRDLIVQFCTRKRKRKVNINLVVEVQNLKRKV